MANTFVKWWKNKILSGYRQLADAGYGRVSDTEELLGAEPPDRLRISCTTPPFEPPEASAGGAGAEAAPRRCPSCPRKLNFEQFSCDVSLEDGVDKSGQQRQEFAFTLYDFDGYGKITKDDIAGLVTTIYEALGSSVKVPHYGSKTIRVKLTVSPDQRKHVSATVVNCPKAESGEGAETPKKSSEKTKKRTKKRVCRRHRCCEILAKSNPRDQIDCDDVSEFSAGSGDNTSEEEKGKKPAQVPGGSETKINKNVRSSSLQRKELLEIIQANMNKNKNNLEGCSERESQMKNTPSSGVKKRPQKHRMPTLHYLANMMDPAHFYVDLASFPNEKFIDAVMCVSNKRVPARKPVPCRKHKREEKKAPQAVLGTTSAPHYSRHRNRQEDQARAMAQVVRWLEREFSSNFRAPEERARRKGARGAAGRDEKPGVERHEHYHVHEHVHHHYHHYEETPVVV